MMIKGISAHKREVLATLLTISNGIITIDKAAAILNLPHEKAKKLLWSLSKSGWLRAMKSGVYVPVPLETNNPTHSRENPLVLAQQLFHPCYMGGWTAAAFWDFTDQLFRKKWVFTTQKVKQKEQNIQEHHFILTHINQEYFFGIYNNWEENNQIAISDPHKTIIDFAQFIDQLGLNAFFDTFESYLASSHKNLKKLIEYALKTNNRTLFKRIGFALEKFSPQDKEYIEQCQSYISKSYSKIATQLSCPRIIRKWYLKIPEYLVSA